jgi:hypothetical protein
MKSNPTGNQQEGECQENANRKQKRRRNKQIERSLRRKKELKQ